MSKERKPGSRQGQVGYGKPPTATRFKAGTSGNPSGKRKNPQGASSEFDVAMRALTRQVTARIGERTERMTALDAIHRKRSELAMKGIAWAVRGCCEDARAYGLASDSHDQLLMRLKQVESVLTTDAAKTLSDEQLRGLIYLLETDNSPQQQTELVDTHEVVSGLYRVGVGSLPNVQVHLTNTAREAHEIVLLANSALQEIKIFDNRGIEITEAGLAALTKREAEKG
jgi:hypothetical protein